jgi:phytoene synthase
VVTKSLEHAGDEGHEETHLSPADAYARCLRIARGHYENFPVASRLLPARLRPHVAAIYAFARAADDFADEGDRPAADRLADLDDWARRLDAAVSGALAPGAARADADAVFVALAQTIRQFRLERELFDDLLSAFRQDVTVRRYDTWADVFDYCRRSANPVGRLVLRLSGWREARLDMWSDDICTALQLTNFWQDLAIDWRRGRLYVPMAVVRHTGAREEDLNAGRMSPEWRAALTICADETRALFDSGRPLPDAVRGRLRWELRATWLGGRRILERLAASGFDVFRARPTLGLSDAVAIAGRSLAWTAS